MASGANRSQSRERTSLKWHGFANLARSCKLKNLVVGPPGKFDLGPGSLRTLIDAFEGLRDNLEISDSAFGKFHSTSFAPWQPTAEVAFEKRDVTADGARRNVQFTRGLGYASIPGCRLECAGSASSDGR